MILLQTKLRVGCSDIYAPVDRSRRRPEVIALLRLAADLNRPISVADLSRELFAGDESVSGGMHRFAIALGLLTGSPESAELTETGKRALEDDAILVREEGTWRIHHLNRQHWMDTPSPWFESHGWIHVERVIKGAAAREDKGTGYYAISLKEERLVHSRWDGKISRIPTGDHPLRKCDALAYDATLTLVWEAGQRPRLRLTPAQNTDMKEVDWEPDLDCLAGTNPGDILLPTILRQAGITPDATRGVTKPFSDLNEMELRKRRTTIRLNIEGELQSEATGENLGKWDSILLTDIPVAPASDADALAWLHWLQWDSIQDYGDVLRIQEAADRFAASFAGFPNLMPMSAAEMRASVLSNPAHPKRRIILAAYDLGLLPVP